MHIPPPAIEKDTWVSFHLSGFVELKSTRLDLILPLNSPWKINFSCNLCLSDMIRSFLFSISANLLSIDWKNYYTTYYYAFDFIRVTFRKLDMKQSSKSPLFSLSSYRHRISSSAPMNIIICTLKCNSWWMSLSLAPCWLEYDSCCVVTKNTE